MRKTRMRVWSILLTVLMLLTLLPISAMAAEGADCDGVNCNHSVQMNGKHYASLREAISEVATNQEATIVMLKDETNVESIDITNGKKITLDLASHQISFKPSEGFSVENGALNATGSGVISSSYGTAYTPTIRITGSGYDVADYSVVTIGKNVTVSNDGSYGMGMFRDGTSEAAYGAKVVIEGTLTSTYGFSVNGMVKETEGEHLPEVIVSESGKIIDGDAAIYAAGYAKYTINGTLEGKEFGIEIRAGELTVGENASITATGDFSDPVPNGNGSTVTGAAIAVSQHTTNLPITVTVNGGSINATGNNGHSLFEIDTVESEGGSVSKDVAVTINGGSFSGGVGSINNKLDISGGSFSSSVKDYVGVSSSAISVTDSSSTKYYVGTPDALTDLIQNAAPGTTVEVEAGSIQAGQVPDGVTVVGTGSGSVTVDKDEATYTVTVIKAATCTANGIVKYTNTEDPSDYYYVAIPAGHKWEYTKTNKPATCGEDGEVLYTCSACKETKNEVIPATGEHNFVESLVDATCTENAKVGLVCAVCGATDGDMVEVPNSKIPHDYETVTVEATCVTDGSITKTCKVCGDEQVEPIPATGKHTEEVVAAKAPTCTEAGYTEGVRCSVCGEILYGMEEIPATGEHTPVTDAAVAPTCNTTGLTEGSHCSVCNEVLVAQVEIPVNPEAHDYELTNTLKEPTCTTTGIGKYVCSYCGASKYQVIDAEHDWDEGEVTEEATCTEAGVMTYTCTVCQETKTEEIAALGHNWNDGEITTPATCGEAGVMTYTCSVCNDTKTEPIPATGEHNYQEGYVDATCTENAKVGLVCAVCGATDGDMVEVPNSKIPHDYETVTVEATCVTDGSITKTCKVCGDEQVEPIPATGKHTEEVVAAKAPTCTEAGYTEGVRCSVCGEILYGMEEIPATGEHTPVTDAAVAPTCNTTGLTEGSHCSVCNEVLVAQVEIPVNPEAHDYELTNTLKEPTCTTTGIGKYVCSYCGASKYQVIDAEHDWDEGEVTEEATCTEAGVMTYTCTVCQETKTEEIAALGHNWNDGEITTPATCGEAGVMTYTCSVCNDTKTEPIPATGEHDYQEGLVEATCTENAKVGMVCTVCGATDGEMEEVPGTALGHDLQEDAETREDATCTEAGSVMLKCSRCDYTEEKVLPATGHTPGTAEYIAPTCTENGKSVVKCTVCGAEIESTDLGDLDPATGHTPVPMEEVAATCTTAGSTGGSKCSVCKAVLEEPTVVPANPDAHVYQLVKTLKDPTCSAPGIGSYKCDCCGKTAYLSIEPLEHSWDEGTVTKPATCTEEGVLTVECQVCQATKTEPIQPSGHTFGEEQVSEDNLIVYKECETCGYREIIANLGCEHENTETKNAVVATCTKDGYTGDTVCTDCGKTLQTGNVISATGHTEEVIPGKAATCTETGLTEGKKCSVCGEVLVAQEEIPMVDHTEEVIPGKAATCTETGLTEGKKCSVCGEVLVAQEEIPMVDHTEEILPGKEATCTETGLTEGKKCSVCGEVLVAQETIPMVAHNYVDGVCTACGVEDPDYVAPCTHENTETKNAVAATCTEDGYTGDTVCTDCGKTLQFGSVIPATGHNEEVIPGKEATCTETGLTEGKKCSVCGTVIVAQETVPAKSHTVVDVPEVPATEESAGTTAGTKCSGCGEILSGCETIPPLSHEHVWDGGVETKAPTCTEAGEMTYTCSCGETRVETIPAKGHSYTVSVYYNEDYTKVIYTYTCSACGDSYKEEFDL